MIITSLATHPIKSLFPISLSTATLLPTGPLYDRTFMLLRLRPDQPDENMHIGIYSQLCLFKQEFLPNPNNPERPVELLVRYTPPEKYSEGQIPRAKNGLKPSEIERKVVVPLEPETEKGGYARREVVMHTSGCSAWDMGDEYKEFFSECLGIEEGAIRLVYLGRGNTRKVLGSVAPGAEKKDAENQESSGIMGMIGKRLLGGILGGVSGEQGSEQGEDKKPGITFSDCAPLLVASEWSLRDICRKFKEADGRENASGVQMSKFRPNIAVGPCAEASSEVVSPWDEDYWSVLSIVPPEDDPEGRRPVTIRLTANCIRCQSLNVDYKTGQFGDGSVGKEQTLKMLQKDRRVDRGSKWSPVFGRYGFINFEGDEGEKGIKIAVGDRVEIVERNQERTVFEWPGLSDSSTSA